MTPRSANCACGHDRDAHEHYRPGSDCAMCPEGVCMRFARPRRTRFPWRRSGSSGDTVIDLTESRDDAST